MNPTMDFKDFEARLCDIFFGFSGHTHGELEDVSIWVFVLKKMGRCKKTRWPLRQWPMRIWPKYWNSLWWPWNGPVNGGKMMSRCEVVFYLRANSGKRTVSKTSFIHKHSKTSSQRFWLFADAHFKNTLDHICIICTREAATQRMVKSSKWNGRFKSRIRLYRHFPAVP